jgi:hypothetical protein
MLDEYNKYNLTIWKNKQEKVEEEEKRKDDD